MHKFVVPCRWAIWACTPLRGPRLADERERLDGCKGATIAAAAGTSEPVAAAAVAGTSEAASTKFAATTSEEELLQQLLQKVRRSLRQLSLQQQPLLIHRLALQD